jgi:trans-2,3-dihydro-3-hydroxyanthranilate isomerase
MSIPQSLPLSGSAPLLRNPRQFDYALVDVFAEAPLEGNMLAVFTDATGLSAGEMQSLAREMNLAETTFILPRDAAIEAQRGVRVRIFTVQEELGFAGHPTLGTASWLYWNHPVLRGYETITVDLPVGPIRVSFGEQSPDKPGVFGTMRQNPPVFGDIHDPSAIALALNLSVEDLDPSLPIQTVSTGMAFCIVPLRSLDAARRLSIPQQSAQAYLDSSDAKFFYCIAPAAPESGAQWHNRMQFYNGEDPATGSASGCAIAYLVYHKRAASGEKIIFEQGIEINRPSRIYVRASFTDSVPGSMPDIGGFGRGVHGAEVPFPDLVFVAGRTIPVAIGRFFLP